MNNDKNIAITSGSINVWVRTSFLSKMTDLMILGAKRAILTWDIESKTISLKEVNKANTEVQTMFTVLSLQVTRAYFPPGKNFFITVDGARYDLSLRGAYTNSAIVADAIDVVDGGLQGAYAESKSDLFILRAFLKKERPDTTYVSALNARKNITVAAAVILVICFIAFLFGVISNV